jgi:nitrogen fixation NifU-like protein
MQVSYNERIMHYLHQDQRIGTLDEALPNVSAIHRQHPASLTRCSLYFALEQESVSAVKYKVYGCGITIASMAWVAEFVENKTVAEITALTLEDIITALEIPKAKHHCAMMVYEMVLAGIDPKKSREKNDYIN